MKKIIILLFVLFFNLNISLIKCIDENKDSLILLLTNENDEIYFTDIPLCELKQCTFPIGPLRNNEILDNKFKKVPVEILNKIKDSIENKEYIELGLFCIDSELNGIKCKTCGFPVPDKGELCYVFRFEKQLKETRAAILNNEQLNDLLIDIETSIKISDLAVDETSTLINTEIPILQSKLQKMLQNLAIIIFINTIDTIEKCKSSFNKCKLFYNKLNSYLKNNICIMKNMNLQFILNLKKKLS